MKFKSIVMIIILLFSVSVAYAQEVVRENAVAVQCGTIIEGEFTSNFNEHNYTINLEPGTALQVSTTPLGSGLETGIFITGPTNLVVWMSDGQYYNNDMDNLNTQTAPSITTEAIGSRGIHTIRVVNFFVTWYRQAADVYADLSTNHAAGIGIYTLYIGCTLRDGTVIEPGASPQPTESSNPGSAPAPVATFSGFGFPGVNPVDFSAGVEIPLSAGQPQVAPVAGDIVALYTYSANANDVATLSISRVSGNISIGVAVIHQQTSEIVFLGGMPSSNNLSVELTFPDNGTYAIGLFKLDTSTSSDTSGAVQITIE